LPKPRHVPVRFSPCPITVDSDVIIIREEEVARADSETHEMDIIGPHTISVSSSLRLAPTSQVINDETQQVSQAEGVTSTCPCCLIPRRLFCSVTGPRESGVPEMNIDRSRSRDDSVVSNTTGDRLTQAEAQTRACFVIIVDINDLMADDYKISPD
jgi:hypothetical protein